VLALEGTGAVARSAAAQKVTFGEVRSPEEMVGALDAVSFEEVRNVARDIAGPPGVACVGPHTAAEFE
jgi:predicted Zn-dependent peptidase